MKSIFSACDAVGILKYNVSTYKSFPSFSDSDEEKRDQKRNYRKVEEIWDIINSYKSRFQEDKDYMANLFNGRIAPYEDKDDEYASRAGNVYDKYTSTWERISGGFNDLLEGIENFSKGLIKSVVDLVVGLVELAVGIIVFIVGGVGVLISEVTGDVPDCLEYSADKFDKDIEMIGAIIEDPTIIVEGLAQEISDSYEEDGVAYCGGYTAGLIAQMVVLKKAKGGKVAEEVSNDIKTFEITDGIKNNLKTEKDTAFFWSGCSEFDGAGNVVTSGDKIAAKIAKSHDGVTLETTISDKEIDMPVWDFDDPSSIKAWEDASAAYANQVSGDVRAVVGSKLRGGNIWENVELPKLMQNENVSRITTINPDTMEEIVIFERDSVGNITTNINDTLVVSGEWNKIIESLKNNDSIKSITITDSSGNRNTIFRR